MAKTEEGRIQKKVQDWAKANEIPVLRRANLPGTSQGWPDSQFILDRGRCAFIEFKAPGKKPTLLQEERLRILRNLGHAARVFDNARDAIDWLDYLWRAD